jgi:hypothetical protein
MRNAFMYNSEYHPVSEVIDSVWHDSASETMMVLLVNGTKCAYAGVSDSVFKAFREAPSAGRYWNLYIKNHFDGLDASHWDGVEKRQPKSETPNYQVTVVFSGSKTFAIKGESLQEAVTRVEAALSELLDPKTFYVETAQRVS